MRPLQTQTMNDRTPWYRQLWPWLLMVPPLGAVIGGIVTIVLAVKTDDGLVSADYYKDGLAINQVLEKDVAARDLGLAGSAWFNFDDGRVQVLLESAPAALGGLNLRLLHPTRDRLDQTIALRGGDGHRFSGALQAPTAGLWYVRLEPDSGEWRLLGRLRVPGESSTRLLPNPL